MIREITAGSETHLRFFALLIAASMIACFGLIANSTAVVIGAMLVSPLMTPIFGIALVVMSFWLPNMLAEEMQNNPAFQQGNNMTPQQMSLLIMLTYGGMGALLCLVAVLSIIGGIKMLRFRSYVFCIVSVAASFFTLFAGCYCFPTSLCVGIYCLIVLLNEPVKLAFELAKRGASAAQIKSAFRNLA